ncbi:MAG: type II 3-dehydroquinate dehydratase [Syntrophomonas sp.]
MAYNILIINGPNLNLLGNREKNIYGDLSLAGIEAELETVAKEQGVQISCFQSNHEGAIVDRIQEARGEADFIIINAGALTHYSIAVHDALRAVDIPIIEVHISNIYAREEFRHHSLISPVAVGGIFGLGGLSYKMALLAACEMLGSKV